jgi:hypothetical protein
VTGGCWIAARCEVVDHWLDDSELADYEAPNRDGRFPVAPSRLRFAHTSPIYVTLDGRGVAERQSIEEGLRMLDRLRAIAASTADPNYQKVFSVAVATARRRLQRRLTRGQ